MVPLSISQVPKSDASRGAPVSPNKPSSDESYSHSLGRSGDESSRSRRALSSQRLKSQKEMWKLEQQVVGALVRVDQDPPHDDSCVQENSLFYMVPGNHKDVYSFSPKPELYGGVDVSFPVNDDDEAVAVYVVIDQRTMKVVYESHEYFTLDIPYIPGFLAFREIAPLQRLVLEQIEKYPNFTPKAILVDGNGILHPRHAGIACFLGTRTGIPTIGIGKTLMNVSGWTRNLVDEKVLQFVSDVHSMIGSSPRTFADSLSHHRGSIIQKTTAIVNAYDGCGDTDMKPPVGKVDMKEALHDLAPYCNGLAIPLVNDGSRKRPKDETDSHRFPVLGCALVGHGGQFSATIRSRPRAGSSRPIYVSVGHRMSLQEAVQIVASLSKHRIPEPVRQADLYGRAMMRRQAAAR
jgi:deoxyinosine 3'endonuclease (endonuclease V)